MEVATAQGALEQARAKAAEQVATAQAEQAKAAAVLRQQQLIAEVVRPAEAEAEKTAITAKAEAERQRILAEAAASSDRVMVDQQLIALLPQIVQAAASGLAGANVTLLNGNEGMSEIVTGLVSQGMAILGTVKESLNGHNAAASTDGLLMEQRRAQ
jgi:regulator of protease activity HflC (stomatin/prohibitin superfamily)